MLGLIYGTDASARVKARDQFVQMLQKKYSDLNLSTINALEHSSGAIRSLIQASDLFGAHRLVVIHNLSLHEEAETLLNDLPKEASVIKSTTVLSIEEKLTKPVLKKYEKYADSIIICDPKKEPLRDERNPFALSDAVLARDRKKVWQLYREAIDTGAREEEIAGMLFWALKTILLAAKESSAQAAGLHPFVYGKSKRALSKWSEQDVVKSLSSLVATIHDARSQSRDSEVALEQFILSNI